MVSLTCDDDLSVCLCLHSRRSQAKPVALSGSSSNSPPSVCPESNNGLPVQPVDDTNDTNDMTLSPKPSSVKIRLEAQVDIKPLRFWQPPFTCADLEFHLESQLSLTITLLSANGGFWVGFRVSILTKHQHQTTQIVRAGSLSQKESSALQKISHLFRDAQNHTFHSWTVK